MFNAFEIKPGIYWVGALEWEEREIHGCTMPYGSTNNAYLITDEKTVLIDTCISSHADELIARISTIVDPSTIDILVSNHSEKDHASSIGRIIELNPNIEIVTSDPHGAKILRRYFGDGFDIHPVKTGDAIEIGTRALQFTATPMVHWPDNMVTYSPTDRILFSNDAFGQFIATSKRFDDEVGDIARVLWCARKYFANIITPYVKQTAKALDALKGLDIETICPAHGVIWRSHIADIMALYEEMSACEPKDEAVVAFSSMYGSTERMALAITEAFMEAGITVRLWDMDISDVADVITDMFSAKYIAVGSPTHNNTVLPNIGRLLTYMKGLAPKGGGRIGIAFGSYGWTEAGAKEIAGVLEGLGYEMAFEAPFTEDWNDDAAGEQGIYEKVLELAEA